MARLPSTGGWAATPAQDLEDFKRMLLKLCPAHAFDDSAVQDFYEALSAVVGKWFSEQQRVEVDVPSLPSSAAKHAHETFAGGPKIPCCTKNVYAKLVAEMGITPGSPIPWRP